LASSTWLSRSSWTWSSKSEVCRGDLNDNEFSSYIVCSCLTVIYGVVSLKCCCGN
jgi:hypothetical protein